MSLLFKRIFAPVPERPYSVVNLDITLLFGQYRLSQNWQLFRLPATLEQGLALTKNR